jgi:hypothetical protein
LWVYSTAGGSVTVPGEGYFDPCYISNIAATPDGGCSFEYWECVEYGLGYPTACDIGDIYSASTTLNAVTAVLTAHFTCGASPTPTPTATTTATPTATPPPGDVNGNWDIEAGDITALERIILGWDSETPWADANGDGTVNASDIGVVEYMILEIWPWNHVHVEAPNNMPYCTHFTATVFITYVEDFGSASFELTYNSTVLDLEGVTNGSLLEIDAGVSAEFHPVGIDYWGLVGGPGAVRINASVGGADGVTARDTWRGCSSTPTARRGRAAP